MSLVQGGIFRSSEKVNALKHYCYRKYKLKIHVILTWSLMLAYSNHLSQSRNDPFLTTYPFIKHKKALYSVKKMPLPW